MIFVSYAHLDEEWRKRFEMMSKPMSRVIPMQFWSDKRIKAGEWETQIQQAMTASEAVVFLVSPAFLASEYITRTELPFFLDAHKKGNLAIFWAYLEPCDLSHQPGKRIKDFQAITLDGNIKPMSAMTGWEWQMTMVNGCQMIDNDFVKPAEKPRLYADAKKKPALPRVATGFRLLDQPARKQVEVLVYSNNNKWYRQKPIEAGYCSTTIHVGAADTKSGSKFKVIALTTDTPLTETSYLNLPDSRTQSEVIEISRA